VTFFVSVDSGIRIRQSYNVVESTHNTRVCCTDLLARKLTAYKHISLVVSAMKEKQYHFLYKPRFCTCIVVTKQANARIPVEGDTDNIHHSPYVTKVECWSPLLNNRIFIMSTCDTRYTYDKLTSEYNQSTNTWKDSVTSCYPQASRGNNMREEYYVIPILMVANM